MDVMDERDVDLALDEERDRVGFGDTRDCQCPGCLDDPDCQVHEYTGVNCSMPGQGFCPYCGYRWDLHDTKVLENVKRSVFGCPTETIARMEWGR